MTSEGKMKKRRLPAWLIGAVVGDAVWGLAVLGAYLFEALESRFPAWFQNLDLPDTLGSICAVIAAPIAVGGWLFIWGDSGPPYQWIESITFNVGFGLCFYALVGVLVSKIGSRFSIRSLFVVMTLVAILLVIMNAL